MLFVSYEFGGFRLDPRRRLLLGADEAPIEIPSRAFDLLIYLVEHPGDVLEKSTLLKAVWPTTVVEESNLSLDFRPPPDENVPVGSGPGAVAVDFWPGPDSGCRRIYLVVARPRAASIDGSGECDRRGIAVHRSHAREGHGIPRGWPGR